MPLIFICELYRKAANPAANIGATLMGVFYVALPLSLMLYMPLIGSEVWNPWIVVAYIATVWSNDVFAYLIGTVNGIGYSIYIGEWVTAVCVLVLAVMAFPTARNVWDEWHKS